MILVTFSLESKYLDMSEQCVNSQGLYTYIMTAHIAITLIVYVVCEECNFVKVRSSYDVVHNIGNCH